MITKVLDQIFDFFKTPSLNEEEFIQTLLEISSFHLVVNYQNLIQLTKDLIRKTINNEQLLSWETRNISFYKTFSKEKFEQKEKYQLILIAWFEKPEEQSKNIDIKFYDEFIFEIKQVTNASLELSEFCYTLVRKLREYLANRFSKTLLSLNSCKIAVILIFIDDLAEYFTFIPSPLIKIIDKNPYFFKDFDFINNSHFINLFYKKFHKRNFGALYIFFFLHNIFYLGQKRFSFLLFVLAFFFLFSFVRLSIRYDFILNTSLNKNALYVIFIVFLLFSLLSFHLFILIFVAFTLFFFFLIIVEIVRFGFSFYTIIYIFLVLVFAVLAGQFILRRKEFSKLIPIVSVFSIFLYLFLSFFSPTEYNVFYLTNSFLFDLKIAYLVDKPNYYFLFFHDVYSSLPDTVCGFLLDPDIDKENIISCSYPNIQKRSVENILFHLLEAERDHYKPCKFLLRRACINIKNERLYLLTEEEFKERVFDP